MVSLVNIPHYLLTFISMISAWSSQGLIAAYMDGRLELIDQTVSLSDPFYRQFLPLKLELEPVCFLQWNWNGSHLLVGYQEGSIEIFRQTAGIVNQFESVWWVERKDPAVFAFCCENRRKFSFNSTCVNVTNTNVNSNSSNVFTSKAFHLNFLPTGRLGFLLVSAQGFLEVYIESDASDFQLYKHDLNVGEVLSGLAFQRPNGKVMIVLESFDSSWSVFEFSELLQAPQLISKLPKTTIPVSKFIWSEAKESLVQLQIESKHVNMAFYNAADFSVSSTIRSAEFKVEIEDICYSSRAPNYLFLRGGQEVSVLNWNGDVVKQLSLESVEGSERSSSLMVSPNGLVVGKISLLDSFPLMTSMPIGEINPKNIVVLREFLGKLISSTLNSSDSWDIFQLIRKSIQKQGDEEGEQFAFITTLLAEWISLLEASNLPPRDFYSKLLSLFKCLPDEFIDAYGLADLVLRFLNLERVLLANLRISTASIDDYSESANTKWPESDQIAIDFESLISILPVLEEGLTLVQELMTHYGTHFTPVITIVPLMDECYRSIGLILAASQSAQKHFKHKSRGIQSSKLSVQLQSFCDRASDNLSGYLGKLELFAGFLHSLRSDPLIQPKCTKNLFLFLMEFYLDPANCKRVQGNVRRIFSRYNNINYVNSTAADTPNNEFFDTIKCLNLPLLSRGGILLCRRCHRASSLNSSKRVSSRREMIFAAPWQQSLWKSRCPCGSQRRLIKLQ